RPHLPFGAPAKYLEPYKKAKLPKTPHPKKPAGTTTWHGSGEFMKYNRWGKDPNKDADFALEVRKHYAACVTYADAQVGRIIKKLNDLDLAKDTIIVVWGDHGWHLGEHAIWGKHALFEESLRSPLIVVAPEVEKPGDISPSVVETIDLFPTLCDLSGLAKPDFLDGASLLPQLKAPFAESKGYAISYNGKAKTIRTSTHRLIAHAKGHLELYSHLSAEGETMNLAESDKETAQTLLAKLRSKNTK
ncbi:sulfatase-like hydrolase/transferase, partial [Akkermansiaceae bacterium]|nr:sulfatase-like hydrolase/transferase [Akkermansiaceae bacterium]